MFGEKMKTKKSNLRRAHFLKVFGFILLSLIGISILVSGGSVIIKNGGLNVNNTFYVNSTSGNVGIGTTSPGLSLDVKGAAYVNAVARGTIRSMDSTAMASGVGGGIIFNGIYTGTSQVDFAGISGVKANATDGNYASELRFYTRANAADLTQKMVIDSSGNVGIGTTDAGARLTISSDAVRKININGPLVSSAGSILGDSGNGLNIGVSATAGDLSLFTNNTAKVTIQPGGNVGIGRTPTTYKLEVEGDASKTVAGSWLANSDARIKKDIGDIDNAVGTLSLVRPVMFKYTDEYKAQHPSIQDKYYYNFIAQEFRKVFPSEVTITNDTLPNGEHILAIDPYVLTPYLVKAVQEQQNQIQTLTAQNEGQQKEIGALNARVAALEARQ